MGPWLIVYGVAIAQSYGLGDIDNYDGTQNNKPKWVDVAEHINAEGAGSWAHKHLAE